MLKDELARVQSKAASHTAIMIALEAELSKTRSTLSQVRSAVAENRSLGEKINLPACGVSVAAVAYPGRFACAAWHDCQRHMHAKFQYVVNASCHFC